MKHSLLLISMLAFFGCSPSLEPTRAGKQFANDSVVAQTPMSTPPSVAYTCGSPVESDALDAGVDGMITDVLGWEIDNLTAGLSPTLKMKIAGVRSIDKANGRTQPKEFVQMYTLETSTSSMMYKLAEDASNAFKFDAVFLQFGGMQVNTAGPVPEGVFDERVSMAFVDSNLYYKNESPMMVKKLVFDCKVSVTY